MIMTEIEKVKPYENNPRKNDDAVNEVAKSIETFGFKNPIIVTFGTIYFLWLFLL